jgi:hypothetical protein
MRRLAILFLTLTLFVVAGCNAAQPAGTQPQPGSPTALQTASPTGPQPGSPTALQPGAQTEAPADEAGLVRGEVFINSQELLVKESYPLQVSLLIKGTLPTPCHKVKAVVSEPDEQNQITVEVYSLVDPNQNCIQVLKAFEENIPLGSYPDGTYTVTLNGEEVGKFTQ